MCMQKESQPKGDMRQCMYNDMNDFYNGRTGMLLSSTLKLASSVRVLLWSFRSNNHEQWSFCSRPCACPPFNLGEVVTQVTWCIVM